jgi:uncharacterized membrane protein
MLHTRSKTHALSITLLSMFFVAAGVNHFVHPAFYLKIMPPYLPAPLALVYVSGLFEVFGGLGVLVPRLRRIAGWGLIALLLAVFPANVHMALQPEQFDNLPLWSLIVRLPLQFVLIVWVFFAAKDQTWQSS